MIPQLLRKRTGISRYLANARQFSRKEIQTEASDMLSLSSGNALFVDKTVAIAKLMRQNVHRRALTRKAFFTRPHKFGKSLTLDIMKEMLSSGDDVPLGLPHWHGRRSSDDAQKLFEGTAIADAIFNKQDPSFGDLFKRPHFVIKLDLGTVESGEVLDEFIRQCCHDLAEKNGLTPSYSLLGCSCAGNALKGLIDCLPYNLPVSLLIDDYDVAVLKDMEKEDWGAVHQGIWTLGRLIGTVQSFDRRIKNCVVTGTTTFVKASLFQGSNYIENLTADEDLSQAIGFSEAEIRQTFPTQLCAVGESILGKDVPEEAKIEEAMEKLRFWFDGHRFNPKSTCFAPYPVLASLKAGRIVEDALPALKWLRPLAPKLMKETFERLSSASLLLDHAHYITVEELQRRSVAVAPLLLQAGLLTPDSVQRFDPSIDDLWNPPLVPCRPPNEHSRMMLRQLLADASQLYAGPATDIFQALDRQDHEAFSRFLQASIESAFHSGSLTLKPVDGDKVDVSNFAMLIYGILSVCPGIKASIAQIPCAGGANDIEITFTDQSAFWILQIGTASRFTNSKFQSYQPSWPASAIRARKTFVCSVSITPTEAGAPKSGYTANFKWHK